MKLIPALATMALLLASVPSFAPGAPTLSLSHTPSKAEVVKLIDAGRVNEAADILSGMDEPARRALLATFDSAEDVERLYRVEPRFRVMAEGGTYLLRYKFAMGEVLRYEVKQSTNLRSTVDGTTQSLKTQSDSVKVWKVTDVLPSGEIEFDHIVESVRMSNETPGHPVREFDSTSSDPTPPGFEAAARAVGVTLVTVRIAPDGKVASRVKKHADQAPPAEDMPITLELPEQAVAVGEKWNHGYDVAVKKQSGVEMKIRTRRLCQLRRVQSGVAVIDVEYQILTPVDPYIRAQIVERLTKGTVRFDIARGRVIQQQHQVDRREVGFASAQNASSMHFVARTQERLLDAGVGVATVTPASATE